jgi:hypothetical protein
VKPPRNLPARHGPQSLNSFDEELVTIDSVDHRIELFHSLMLLVFRNVTEVERSLERELNQRTEKDVLRTIGVVSVYF